MMRLEKGQRLRSYTYPLRKMQGMLKEDPDELVDQIEEKLTLEEKKEEKPKDEFDVFKWKLEDEILPQI